MSALLPASAVARDEEGATFAGQVVKAARSAEPVVLTGADLPAWSRHAAVGSNLPWPSGALDGTRSAHHGLVQVPADARTGAPIENIAAYRWDGLQWAEIPVQVDERFPYFLSNSRSDFSIYSGVDQELTYAWDVENWKKVAGECSARYARDIEEVNALMNGDDPVITPGLGETPEDYLGAMPDPAEGLDDDDEVAFMAGDAGGKAPLGQSGPPGTEDKRHEVALTDPLNPSVVRYVYLFQKNGGSSFNSGNGYVSYSRDANADEYIDRYSIARDDPETLAVSNTGYGPNLAGKVCRTAVYPGYPADPDGTPRDSTDRFPRDGVTVTTDQYRWYASGRWMVRNMSVADPEGTGYGPDLIDRWKGRAFQQSPDSTISLVGFEDEQVNWEANSALIGERAGPVRAIRETWGADSGTNVTKTETFYRDAVLYHYHLRVHPIPPDGLYTSWDYNKGVAAKYYNVLKPDGVDIDGANDDVGNIDNVPTREEPAFFDVADPTFDIPLATGRWEQVSGIGDAGSLVYMFESVGAASAENPTVVPYYRDDACLDDGTGDDPVPRPWPGEATTDQRVRDGYVAYWRDRTGDDSITYEDLTCEQKQGAWGSHGIHYFFTGDTDNAFVGAPVTEVEGQQWQFAVPTASPRPVGEAYAEMLRARLVPAAVVQLNSPGPAPAQVRAGASKVDSTWHVGASAGQYASDGVSVGDHGVDPHTLSTRRSPSYGIQGREWVRALVVEGSNGKRFALVANDLYIPQDLVNRRVAQLLADHDRDVLLGLTPGPVTGIDESNMTISVSHSHSSPYYSTPSWGVWAFQDVFDIRFFEHIAGKMAQAVIEAASDMRPVRMGAAASPFTKLKRHSFGPAIANDGTPAGYPQTDVDGVLNVVRFDDMTDPSSPQPLANWVVFGLHPEMLDGNDLLTGEYVNTMYRFVDREVGGITLFSQNDTGTAEPARNADAHAPGERQEFSHREYAQMERAARTLADAVIQSYRDVATVSSGGSPALAAQVEHFATLFPVGVKDLRFAPPGTRLFPTVSSCRTDKTFDGNPGVPIVGLPDCEFPFGNGGSAPNWPFEPGVTYDMLKATGIPVPDNISAPSYTGLQETLQVHLQAVRLGNLGITVCPCEQWADQSRNIRSRLNTLGGDFWFGWDWTSNYTQAGWEPGRNYANEVLGFCSQNPDTTWTCKNPRNPSADLPPVTDRELRRMKAQIYNDARGWEDLENLATQETEPLEIEEIKGNYTHEELNDVISGDGYPMVITVGMSNDYWGYIATYREYSRGDHYRKSLTGLGPHSSDFLATRLSRMAAELKGGPSVDLTEKDLAYAPEFEHEGARARAIGESARTYLAAYEAKLPPDGGAPQITEQPQDVERFGAARIGWIGGSNYSDLPHAQVERCKFEDVASCTEDSDFEPFADGQGEVQVKANYPQAEDTLFYGIGLYAWEWDATFEAFDSDIRLIDAMRSPASQTPTGVYRFVVEGCHRGAVPGGEPSGACGSRDPGGRVSSYRLESDPFQVKPWTGITVPSITLEPNNTVSLTVGPEYPFPISASNTEAGPIDYADTYSSPFRFISGREAADRRTYGAGEADDEVFCFHCSFRPWADTGSVQSVSVTIVRANGSSLIVPATFNPATARWHTSRALKPNESAVVMPGGIIDTFGETNGAESARVTRLPGGHFV